jgi:starch synthase (maltosyl-transferring)
VIDDIHPTAPQVGYPAKAVVGETIPVSAVIFKDGHDILAARVQLVAAGESTPDLVVPMRAGDSDRWEATVVPTRLGRHQLVVAAWTDRYATWAHRVRVKLDAGQDVDAEIADGRLLLAEASDLEGPR